MEELLCHIWKNRLYTNSTLRCVDGTPIEILDTGCQNTNAGPDFFNAKIKVGQTVWVGNVEIHDRSSMWYHHNHHLDEAYDSVVLHVVSVCDAPVYRTNSEPIWQFEMNVPAGIEDKYKQLKQYSQAIPCAEVLRTTPPLFLLDWKTTLGMERLQQKARQIQDKLERYRGDWEEVFYITLARSLGTGINSDAFERLARALPQQYWRKHANSLLQMEALFLGQSGFLSSENIEHPYYLLLRREYSFLAHKFRLNPLPHSIWKSFRIRPNAFPQLRIAYLATLLHTHARLFDLFLHAPDLNMLRKLLQVPLSSFWDTHYQFEESSIDKPKALGVTTLNSILINAYIPLLYAYAGYHEDSELSERAIALLESIDAENNVFVRKWRTAGLKVCNAFDSQAVIQLQRCYCEQHKCMYCKFGHRYIKKPST